MEIEVRSRKLYKKSWPFGDVLEEVSYDNRWVIPLWKLKIIKFFLG